MKRIFAYVLAALFLLAPAAFAAEGLPMTLAGITLGDDVKKYNECCNVQLDAPMADAPFLNEVHLKSDFVPGIRGGSLIYGNCKNIGKVVRIKFKFHNRGQKLFNELLAKYKKAYGNPDTYKGDAFKNVIAWEWQFAQDGKRVNLMLMWSRDKEIRPGVSIKMTYASLLDEEYECYKEQMNLSATGKKAPTAIKDLHDFVPK